MKDELSFTISPDERSARRRQIHQSLSDKQYRDEFVRQQIETGLPFQIKGMRKVRGWNQSELGKRLGTPQSVVSRLENPDYGKFSIQTLRELANVFDVALLVAFIPFSHLVNRVASFSNADVEIPEFDKDPGFKPSYIESETSVSELFPQGRTDEQSPLCEANTASSGAPFEQTELALRNSDLTALGWVQHG